MLLEKLPHVASHFERLSFTLPMIATQWFSCLFVKDLGAEVPKSSLPSFMAGLALITKLALTKSAGHEGVGLSLQRGKQDSLPHGTCPDKDTCSRTSAGKRLPDPICNNEAHHQSYLRSGPFNEGTVHLSLKHGGECNVQSQLMSYRGCGELQVMFDGLGGFPRKKVTQLRNHYYPLVAQEVRTLQKMRAQLAAENAARRRITAAALLNQQ